MPTHRAYIQNRNKFRSCNVSYTKVVHIHLHYNLYLLEKGAFFLWYIFSGIFNFILNTHYNFNWFNICPAWSYGSCAQMVTLTIEVKHVILNILSKKNKSPAFQTIFYKLLITQDFNISNDFNN